MTYSTTHLGISTLLVYFFLPKSSKEYLKNHPKAFFLTSLGSIAPDLDLFTSGHRAYGHSIFIPLLLMLLPALFSVLGKELEENPQKYLRYFGLFWLSHLLYDTTFGPIAIFFPIDTRFYDITIGLVLLLTTRVITPVGFFVNVNIIDQRNGIDTFFVNWTASQRVSYFGSDHFNLPITDFFVHATIFLWYCIFVVAPYIRYKRGAFIYKGYQARPSNIEIKLRPWLTAFLLVLLTTSFFMAGPYHGKTWINERNESSTVYVLQDTIQLLGSKSYRVSSDSSLDLVIKADTEVFSYQVFVMQLDSAKISEIRQNTTDLINSYNNNKITFIQMLESYQSYIKQQIPVSAVKNVTKTNKISWEYHDSKATSVIFGLYDWNSSMSFINTLDFKSVWTTDVSFSYYLGMVLMSFSGIITVFSIYSTTKKMKNSVISYG